MAYQVACLLLREAQWNVIPVLLHKLSKAGVHEAGQARSAQRATELLRDAGHWNAHAGDWYLHGTPTGHAVPRVWQRTEQAQITCSDALVYVEQLAQAYAWCLLPWGVDATGQMLLVLAADEASFTEILTWLRRRYNSPEEHDLVVSTYPAEAVHAQHFRGAIFGRAASWCGHGIWHHGRGTSAAALVLRSDIAAAPLEIPVSAEVVYQAHATDPHPVLRTWVRVHDEAALLQLVATPSTVIVTAADLDDQLMCESLGSFSEIFVDIRNDPLYFGLKALQSASWIYVPKTQREGWEIYINNDPAVTSRLLHSPELTGTPDFVHKYFC